MIRYFDKDIHYSVLCEWLTIDGGATPDYDMVPDSGFVDYVNGTINSMVLMYKTNSKIVIAEFMMSNPFISKKEVSMSIRRIIKALYNYCDENDLYAFNLCNDKKIRSFLEKFGTKFGYGGLDLMVYKGDNKCHQQ